MPRHRGEHVVARRRSRGGRGPCRAPPSAARSRPPSSASARRARGPPRARAACPSASCCSRTTPPRAARARTAPRYLIIGDAITEFSIASTAISRSMPPFSAISSPSESATICTCRLRLIAIFSSTAWPLSPTRVTTGPMSRRIGSTAANASSSPPTISELALLERRSTSPRSARRACGRRAPRRRPRARDCSPATPSTCRRRPSPRRGRRGSRRGRAATASTAFVS